MSVKNSLSILVVDDTSVSRGLIIMSLEEIGFKRISFAKDGGSAFDLAVREGVHLVISDQNMPGMSGLQLLGKLRQTKSTQKVGFILVSGKLDQSLIDDARRYGANNVLEKPFDTKKMRACLKPLVGVV